MNPHNYYIYIITNPTKTVLYTGVTNDLLTRLHAALPEPGQRRDFRGEVSLLPADVLRALPQIQPALAREKEIKGWTRAKKEELISQLNPDWQVIDPLLWEDALQ